MKLKKMLGVCVCVVLLGVNGIVLADSSYSKKEKSVSLDTITVTAQKQEQNLQEVPESVSVLSSLDLEDRNIKGLWKAADFIPNLMLFDIGMTSFFSQPSIRGVYASAPTMSSSVGLYVDEIPVLGPAGFTADLLDVERIEVLRGPQGTLYGSNAEVGAMRVVSRDPDNEFRSKIMVQGGENKHAIAMANISGPLAKDKLFFSLAGKYDRRDGQIDNTFLNKRADDQQKWYGRGQLRLLASDDLDISLVWSHMGSNEGGPSFTPGAKILGIHGMMGIPPMGKYEVRSNRDAKSEITNDLGALKIHCDLNENISLTSVTSATRMKLDDLGDWDFSPADLMASTQDSTFRRIAEEIRLSYKGERVHGLLGFYADRKKDNTSNTMWMFGTTTKPASQIRGDSYALFGQLDYALIPDLHLIGGLRYGKQNEEKKDFLSSFHGNKSWSDVSPKIAVSYQFTPSINIYASASKGFRSGGFSKDVNNVYDPEKLWSYETGVKTIFLDGRAMINASVYYMDIDDMQVEKHINPTTSTTENAAEASAKGYELELTVRPEKGIQFNAGFGYCDITFDSYHDTIIGKDYSGNKNPYAPEYTYNFGAIYRHTTGFYASADIVGYGNMYMDAANKDKKDAYCVTHAKIGYEFENLDVYLYAENLFDEELVTKNYFGFYNVHGSPREVGLQLVYRF